MSCKLNYTNRKGMKIKWNQFEYQNRRMKMRTNDRHLSKFRMRNTKYLLIKCYSTTNYKQLTLIHINIHSTISRRMSLLQVLYPFTPLFRQFYVPSANRVHTRISARCNWIETSLQFTPSSLVSLHVLVANPDNPAACLSARREGKAQPFAKHPFGSYLWFCCKWW